VELLQDFSKARSASINMYKKTKDPVQLGPLDWATKEVLGSLYSAITEMWEKRGMWEFNHHRHLLTPHFTRSREYRQFIIKALFYIL
jgi:hypothetical protein